MQLRSVVTVTTLAGLALVPVTQAAKPVKPTTPKPGATTAVSLAAKPALLTFTQSTALSGSLTGSTPAGVSVRLEQDTIPPLGDRFASTGRTTTTAANGSYRFTVAPAVTTQYRVVAKSSPGVTSAAQLVRVRPLVGLTVSDSTPRRNTSVSFSGSVRSAHDGSLVSIQRRTATGRWATVARTRLKDAGTTRSAYARRLRIRASGTYRVVLPAHSDHVTGISRTRKLSVG